MNPATTANPTMPRPVIDMTRPQAPTQPAPVAAPPNAGLTTNIVDNIPMHAPAQPVGPTAPQPAPKAMNEDDELEHIMKDIGQELKQADRKIAKKHFSLFGRKHSHPAPVAAPVPRPAPVAAAVVAAPAAPAQAPASAQASMPQAAPAAAVQPATKPVKTTSAPLGAIFMTILVTGALIAAAIYSYK